MALCGEQIDENLWLLDPGATTHMMPSSQWFKTYKECGGQVKIGNGSKLKIVGKGKKVVTVWMMRIDGLQSTDFMCGENGNSSCSLRSFQNLFSQISMNWVAFVVLMGKKS